MYVVYVMPCETANMWNPLALALATSWLRRRAKRFAVETLRHGFGELRNNTPVFRMIVHGNETELRAVPLFS